jgi:hypothetical protein
LETPEHHLNVEMCVSYLQQWLPIIWLLVKKSNKNVDIKIRAHDSFLEYAHNKKKMEIQLIQKFLEPNKKRKGIHRKLKSSMVAYAWGEENISFINI